MNQRSDQLRREILERTRELVSLQKSAAGFVPGVTPVPYAGRVFGEEEVTAAVENVLEFWLTLGPQGAAFEREFATMLGVSQSVFTNSGSSANLLAFGALTSHRLGDRRILPGSEVITAALGFPTTVAPIIQHGCIPVFVDVNPATANIRVEQLENACVTGRTRAVVLAHTLGNPFDLSEVTRFCKERGLWLIEDNCDALGSLYDSRHTGTFGDLSTQSFYPAHHMTTGEGGMVNINAGSILRSVVESLRDWGRDCWCSTGHDNTCNKRFEWQRGGLPHGYDHKYIYSHLGYNLKPLDMQAAIGRAQIKRLPSFAEARRTNWLFLRNALADLEDCVDFMLPTHASAWNADGFSWSAGCPKVDPSWFGFMIVVKPGSRSDRNQLARELDGARIGCRMLFGGNLARQPAFTELYASTSGAGFRTVGDLTGTDHLMNNALFVGTFPGLGDEHLSFVAKTIRKAVLH